MMVDLQGTPVRGGSGGGWNVHASVMSGIRVQIGDIRGCKDTSSDETGAERAEVVRETEGTAGQGTHMDREGEVESK